MIVGHAARLSSSRPLLGGAPGLRKSLVKAPRIQAVGAQLTWQKHMSTKAEKSKARPSLVPWAAMGFISNSTMLIAADFLEAKVKHLPWIKASALSFYGDWTSLGCAGFANVFGGTVAVTIASLAGAVLAQHSAQPSLINIIRGILAFFVGSTCGLLPIFWPEDMRLWEPPPSAKRLAPFSDKLRRFGVNVEELSRALLTHLSDAEHYEELDENAFKELISAACPKFEDKADTIWKIVDWNNSGKVEFETLFVLLVSGPFSAKKFTHLTWTEQRFGTKCAALDKGYQKLFRLINRCSDAIKTADIDEVVVAVRTMREYTVHHFDRKIAMLRRNPDYPKVELEKHLVAHAEFVHKVCEFEALLAKKNVSAVCGLVIGDMIGFCTEWITNHIETTDVNLYKFFPNGMPQGI